MYDDRIEFIQFSRNIDIRGPCLGRQSKENVWHAEEHQGVQRHTAQAEILLGVEPTAWEELIHRTSTNEEHMSSLLFSPLLSSPHRTRLLLGCVCELRWYAMHEIRYRMANR